MIYAEIKQKIIEASTISFSGNTISDSGSGLSGFFSGDKILIYGSDNGTNDVQRKIVSASAGSIVVDGSALTTQTAGNLISIKKIEFFADPGKFFSDSRGATKFFYPGVISISDVFWKPDGSFVKINDGSISINRKNLLGEDGLTKFDLQDKTKLFEFLIKLSHDGAIIFDNAIGIIRNLDEMQVTFQIKTEIPDSDWLLASADIESGSTYDQGRFLPKIIGTVYHFPAFLQFYSTYQYYSGGTTVYSAYDDGQVVQFNNVTTSYLTGNTVQYNGNAYIANIDNPTTSPTGGSTNNTGWNYTGAASGENHFQAIAYNFTLNAAPVGLVTIDVAGEYNTLETLCETLSGLVKVPGQSVIGTGISFDNATSKILDSNNLFSSFVGNSTDITGQRILVTGGANDGTYFRVSASSSGELTVSPAPTTESAGSSIKIEGFYGFSKEFSDGTASINHPYQNQMKVIDVLKEVCDFHEHIFFFDKQQKLMYLIDKEIGSGTITRTKFNINLDEGVQYLTKDVIFGFKTDWIQKIPVLNPTALFEQERITEVLTGVETGVIKNVNQFENNESSLTTALEKKRDLYLNYDRIELMITKDIVGIDTNIFPGKIISFESWISGDLFVEELGFEIISGNTVVRGIANGIVFE